MSYVKMFRPDLGEGWVVRVGSESLPGSCGDQLSCEGGNGFSRSSAADWGLEWCEVP